MERFKLWDKVSNITIIGGKVLTPNDVYSQFSNLSRSGETLLEYMPDGLVGGIDNVDILRQVFEVPAGLTVADAVAQIVDKKLNPPPAPPRQEDIDRADIDFIALMTGVEL